MLSTHSSKSNSMFGTFSDKCSGQERHAIDLLQSLMISLLFFLPWCFDCPFLHRRVDARSGPEQICQHAEIFTKVGTWKIALRRIIHSTVFGTNDGATIDRFTIDSATTDSGTRLVDRRSYRCHNLIKRTRRLQNARFFHNFGIAIYLT